MATWRQSLNGSFPSRLEKLRAKLAGQRQQSTAANVRQFLTRKIKLLDELLEGPKPPAAESTAPLPRKNGASRAPTDEELLDGANYLISEGKYHLLSPAQQELLAREEKAGNPVPG